MNKNKKFFCLVLLVCLICFSSIATFYYSSAKEKEESELSDKEYIEITINNYFNEYFRSLDKLEKPNFKGILEDNVDNKLYIAANELKVQQLKLVNLAYKNSKFNLDFLNLNINNTNARVEVSMRCKFNYATHLDTDSGMANIHYSFNLKKNKGKWIVTKMDTDLDDYRLFKEMVNEKNQKSNNKEKNIEEVKEQLLKGAKDTLKYLGGKPN